MMRDVLCCVLRFLCQDTALCANAATGQQVDMLVMRFTGDCEQGEGGSLEHNRSSSSGPACCSLTRA
jgi:hypothetical protein